MLESYIPAFSFVSRKAGTLLKWKLRVFQLQDVSSQEV